MSKQVRFRRGTTAQHATFTGAEAEITVDTTKNQVVVHDGATAGGIPLLREDRPRGYTKMEFVTSSPYNWTKDNKTDLKRIRVTAYGGGGGGGTSSGGGGGQGGIGFVTLEVADVQANVTVTIGAGAAAGGTGGTTSFGSYLICTGGSPGTTWAGGASGSASGGGSVYALGGQGGQPNTAFPWGGHPSPGHPGANAQANAVGGGIGGGHNGVAANGVYGGGGGGNAAGTQGCVIIEEIYGLV